MTSTAKELTKHEYSMPGDPACTVRHESELENTGYDVSELDNTSDFINPSSKDSFWWPRPCVLFAASSLFAVRKTKVVVRGKSLFTRLKRRRTREMEEEIV